MIEKLKKAFISRADGGTSILDSTENRLKINELVEAVNKLNKDQCLLPSGLLKSSCFNGCDCKCHLAVAESEANEHANNEKK